VNGVFGVKRALPTGLATVFMCVLPAGSASASTTAQCTPSFHHSASGTAIGAGEYCVDTTSQYRVRVECLDPLHDSTLYVYGPMSTQESGPRKTAPSRAACSSSFGRFPHSPDRSPLRAPP
jgi:hypothetical protein